MPDAVRSDLQQQRSNITYARLFSISSAADDAINGLDTGRTVMINFPCMPETITLARSVEYSVANVPFAPDGVHIFKFMRPMEIPISFKLHASDYDYCKNGAYDLLVLGAKLHALAAAIGDGGTAESAVPQAGEQTAGQNGDNQKYNEQTQKSVTDDPAAFATAYGTAAAPPVCVLDLITTKNAQGPGVTCYGYVNRPSVKYRGPWLYTQTPAGGRNLPTSAEYEFTFMHAPNYRNKYVSGKRAGHVGKEAHMFAEDIRDMLYNSLAKGAVGGAGFVDLPSREAVERSRAKFFTDVNNTIRSGTLNVSKNTP